MPVPRGQPRHEERTRLYYSLDKVGSGHPWDPGRPGTHAGGSARRRGLNGLNRRLFPWSSLSSTQSDHDYGHSDVVFGEHLFFNTEAMSLSFKEKGREKGRKERRERGRKLFLPTTGIRGIEANSERRKPGSAATCLTADSPDEVSSERGKTCWLSEPASPQRSVRRVRATHGERPKGRQTDGL